MFEWTISFGTSITLLVTLIGFGCTILYHSYKIGGFVASTTQQLKQIVKNIEELELASIKITEILVDIAKSKAELQILSKRIDDIQMYGSHRLAEVLDNQRKTIMEDLKERFDFMERHMLEQDKRLDGSK